jgi:hypothetical protein
MRTTALAEPAFDIDKADLTLLTGLELRKIEHILLEIRSVLGEAVHNIEVVALGNPVFDDLESYLWQRLTALKDTVNVILLPGE